ncbi:hypothetical protein [Shewanella colwelliana]|uniref:hypothetical protein n=1 Tax=Shewanella colwelliana TaxID=23 RepID=UPI003735FEE0
MRHPIIKMAAASLLCTLSYGGYADDTASQDANRLLQLANDTELANAETQAAMAKLEARRAKQKLTAPKQGQNAIERTTQPNNQMGGNNAAQTRSPIDNVELKSLVTTSGVTTAWIALDGELIEVKKGSQIGALKVIDLDENSVRFSDGHKTKRKWMAGFKAKAQSQQIPIRGR